MSYIFLDTNALIKLYIPEKGSTWLKSFIVGKTICISELALFESATTLARNYLEGNYTRNEVATIFTKLTQDTLQYNVVSLSSDEQKDRVFEIATAFVSGARVRTLDAIQLAAAQTQLEVANNEIPPKALPL